mgnify:CR=1 FL=1
MHVAKLFNVGYAMAMCNNRTDLTGNTIHTDKHELPTGETKVTLKCRVIELRDVVD